MYEGITPLRLRKSSTAYEGITPKGITLSPLRVQAVYARVLPPTKT